MNSSTLEEFVASWRQTYIRTTGNLALFNQTEVARLSNKQRKFLTRALYHVRGHFYPFLWFSASLAPSADFKGIVLDNFKDEFGDGDPSHEQLYGMFAHEMGVHDIFEEVVTEQTYLPFVRKFVKGQLDLIVSRGQDWDFVWSAYTAIEALDNVDYRYLWQMAIGLNVSEKNLGFFKVHMAVQHYELAGPLLRPIWGKDQEKVKEAFAGIAELQLGVWQGLSDVIFAS